METTTGGKEEDVHRDNFQAKSRNITGKALEMARSVLRDRTSLSGTQVPERMDSKLVRDEATGMLITVTVISVSSYHTDKYICHLLMNGKARSSQPL